jgi:lipopolysaccharide/colanic/teichoic acid biosynthesis glycosyltransferase
MGREEPKPMSHDRAPRIRQGSLLTRKRFQFAGALIVGALLPWFARGPLLPGELFEPASINGLIGNTTAIVIAFWMRLSIETYPGIRRSAVILPSALTGHGTVVVWFVLTRFPYDRVGLAAGFLFHVVWLYLLYIYAERNIRRKIAVVPYGEIEPLKQIDNVDWFKLSRPRLHDARDCHAIVADFSADDIPDEWEAFLADAALAGRIVYQVKQLSESLTGRVELEHLSENSFGSLLPARGYFHLKGLIDFLAAVAMLPVALPLMAVIAVAIRLDSKGAALFRQKRVGHSGKRITIYKFRTMLAVDSADERDAAMTRDGDDRVTKVGRLLRKWRVDELPQIFNILKWQMSWIGPRPEAEVLSVWYTSEIPFYRYRHVVKPGISGWAQVNQGHVAQVDEVHRKLQYDFYYIKYFSPWLDVLILFRTIKTMLTGYGSR